MEQHYGFNLDKIIDREEEVSYEPTIERDADGMYELKMKKVVEENLEGKNMNTEKKPDMSNESNIQAVATVNNAEQSVSLQNPNPSTSPPNLDKLAYKIAQEVLDADLTEDQRRGLKNQIYQGSISNTEFASRKNIELNAYWYKKNIDFTYMRNTEILKKKVSNGSIKMPLITDDGIVLAQNDDQNFKNPRRSDNEIIESFIEINELVKERDKTARDGYNIQMRDHTFNRHEIVTKDYLKEKFSDHILAMKSADDILPSSHIDDLFKRMIHKIKYVEDLSREKKIVKISQYEIVCKGEIYDVLSGKTSPINSGDLKLYNKHSFSIEFQPEDCEPEGFNKILQAIFRDDETKIKTMWEVMGLIYSGIATVKKIVLLQGLSNSGKSRIARIIASGFDEDYVVTIDKLNDLKGDENFNNIRLVIIDELPDKKLNPSQVSNLKKLSNGSKQVKILATTNHAVYTGDDRAIDKALLNRLLVIPFDNVMDNSDEIVSAYEDVYYEQERDIIVSKALKAFHDMLARSENIANLQFSNNYPANDCVEVSVVPNEMNQINVDVQNINSVLEQKNQASIVTEDSLKQVLEGLYEITETINPEISTEIVMSDVNTVLKQEIFTDRQGFGKKMNNYYGDKLHSERKNGKMCYNLKYKNLVETK